eukprot:g6234.t1
MTVNDRSGNRWFEFTMDLQALLARLGITLGPDFSGSAFFESVSVILMPWRRGSCANDPVHGNITSLNPGNLGLLQAENQPTAAISCSQ